MRQICSWGELVVGVDQFEINVTTFVTVCVGKTYVFTNLSLRPNNLSFET